MPLANLALQGMNSLMCRVWGFEGGGVILLRMLSI